MRVNALKVSRSLLILQVLVMNGKKINKALNLSTFLDTYRSYPECVVVPVISGGLQRQQYGLKKHSAGMFAHTLVHVRANITFRSPSKNKMEGGQERRGEEMTIRAEKKETRGKIKIKNLKKIKIKIKECVMCEK